MRAERVEEIGVPAAEAETGAVLRCFADIAPEKLQWLWQGRIPRGKLALLIGDPGLGKSLTVSDIAARVTRGTPFPDGTGCESGEAILLNAEDGPGDTMRPRLDAAGADVFRVHVLEAVRVRLADGTLAEKSFSLETDIAALEGVLQLRPSVRLIAIDPISSYLGGTDSHSNAEVRGLLAPLAALATKYDVTVLGVTHLRKSAGAAIHRAISSIAFVAAARAVWAVTPDPADPERRLFLPVKQNLAANDGGLAFRVEEIDGVPKLAWEPGAVHIDVNDVMCDQGPDDGGSTSREAQTWLADVLDAGAVPTRQIQADAKTAGLPWIAVRRAKSALGIVARKDGYQGNWQWEMPAKDAQRSSKALSVESEHLRAPLSTFGVEKEAVLIPQEKWTAEEIALEERSRPVAARVV